MIYCIVNLTAVSPTDFLFLSNLARKYWTYQCISKKMQCKYSSLIKCSWAHTQQALVSNQSEHRTRCTDPGLSNGHVPVYASSEKFLSVMGM